MKPGQFRPASTGILLGTMVALLLHIGVAPLRAAEPVRLLLDWSWLPYHSPFLIAKARGFYQAEGLDVDIEQGRGSASSAEILSQGGFDISHLNVTNAAQLIGKDAPITVVAIYQHKSGASFIGIKGHVTLTDPQSLIGPRIGSTPGGSDGLSLKIFTAVSHIPESRLNIVSLDTTAKTAALFSGTLDVVSGDAPAYEAYVRATGQQPETLLLSNYDVPLIGFGFAVNNSFMKAHPDAIRKFLVATRRGFAAAAQDPHAACVFMRSEVHLAGTDARCVDYFNNLMALSTSPTDPSWGLQTVDEWQRLVSTLQSVGAISSKRPASEYYTNEFLPQ